MGTTTKVMREFHGPFVYDGMQIPVRASDTPAWVKLSTHNVRREVIYRMHVMRSLVSGLSFEFYVTTWPHMDVGQWIALMQLPTGALDALTCKDAVNNIAEGLGVDRLIVHATARQLHDTRKGGVTRIVTC